MLAFIRPYKRSDDLYLALITNVLLVSCFSMGSILEIREQSYGTSLLVVIFIFTVLIISVLAIVVMAYTVTTYPQIRLAKSCQKPNYELRLEANCTFHAFSSHVWKTGQHRTHAIVRKLQLLMPELKIWLDVDEIDKAGGDLEHAVEDSVVFLLVYSRGYFQSTNCRREIDTALALERPIIVIYTEEEDTTGSPGSTCESVVESMWKEYEEFCVQHDEITSSKMFDHISIRL